MNTKPKFTVSKLANMDVRDLDPKEVMLYSCDTAKKMYGIVDLPPPPVVNKMDALLVKDGPILDGAYIDRNGYPRFFNPEFSGEDEFLMMQMGYPMLVPPEKIYIIAENELIENIPDGMVWMERPELMKNQCRHYVDEIIHYLNGACH